MRELREKKCLFILPQLNSCHSSNLYVFPGIKHQFPKIGNIPDFCREIHHTVYLTGIYFEDIRNTYGQIP